MVYLQFDYYNSHSGELQLANCSAYKVMYVCWYYTDPKQMDHYNTEQSVYTEVHHNYNGLCI